MYTITDTDTKLARHQIQSRIDEASASRLGSPRRPLVRLASLRLAARVLGVRDQVDFAPPDPRSSLDRERRDPASLHRPLRRQDRDRAYGRDHDGHADPLVRS